MKSVYFCRHAKSSWEDMSLRDHDRPLNARGLRDAPLMVRYLNDLGYTFDGIWSSTANRALSTARIFARHMGVDDIHFHQSSELYHSSPDQMVSVLRETISDYNSIALFAHNPGMTQMANLFSPNIIDNVPTCGVFKIEFEVDSWSDIALYSGLGKWDDFWTPKSIR